MKNKEGQSERDLLLAIKNNDRQAFDCLYNRYWNVLLDNAFTKLGNSEEAQELVQQLFVDLYKNRDTIQIRTSLDGYLFAALKYKVIDHYRRVLRRTAQIDAWQHFTEQDVQSPDALLEMKETNEKLQKLIDSLPDKCREVFKLSRFEHIPHQEIAEKLNISESTVKKHIHKALTLLRGEMKKDFLLFLLLSIFINN